MSTFNQLTIVGNLTRDPESKTVKTANGDTLVTKISVAVNNPRNKEKVSYFNCSIWGKPGETAAKYLTKGSSVLVAGSITIDSYEKDGTKYQSAEVRVSEFQMLGKKAETSNGAATAPVTAEAELDEIPF